MLPQWLLTSIVQRLILVYLSGGWDDLAWIGDILFIALRLDCCSLGPKEDLSTSVSS
jgi:hypothetical protein